MLGQLAGTTHRSESHLAVEPIEQYVAREAATIAGIERGLRDVRAGRVIPHDEAMSRLEAVIGEAEQGLG